MFRDLEYAVLDVETTGFSAATHDRIVEVAVVRTDSGNRVISEYSTLVNPHRDVGPTHVHGLRAGDVAEAPSFGDIVGDVLAAIRGAVVVAHNASFDMRFLTSECARAGAALPAVPYLCTLALSRRVCGGLPSRKLSALCEHFGVELKHAHSALADARAAAALLSACFDELRREPGPIPMIDLGARETPAQAEQWPTIASCGRCYLRTDAARRHTRVSGQMQRLLDALPPVNDTANNTDDYLAVLERALEDRAISDEEVDALAEVARELDMDREEARSAHLTFLAELIDAAWLDGVITDAEQADIDTVAALLGITVAEKAALFERTRQEQSEGVLLTVGTTTRTAEDNLTGRSVCFTGATAAIRNGRPLTRVQIEQIAADHGMIVRKSVTKKLDYLVCADPATMSGKARKARDYGVRILAEQAFFKMIEK